ncbi:type II toxin-antitoxin system RelE family toxin [Agaribacterium haliotis]|uniref:type II toxin-antitoxin system RelE family toxin n=1 Tax=Agaribacterium haliotis TaxID=2013869 RepID=UPI003BB99E48
MKSLASLPRDVQAKARRAVEYIKSDNERSVKPNKLKGGRNLYSGSVDSKYRVIYSKSKDTITIVDIIKVDTVANVMRSES